jgi:hypothetical protein
VATWTSDPIRSLAAASDQISTDLAKRGKLLRAEIDSTFKAVGAQVPLRGTDITKLVEKYIPLGTSFDDAEQVLRCAGFTVYPRPPSNIVSDRPDRYNVAAFLQLRGAVFYKTQAIVSLAPRAPGDYSTVTRISAGIFSSAP